MAFQLPPLPNFQTNIPQTPSLLDQASKAATLSQMMNTNKLQQQLAPLQVQEQQQKVQSETLANTKAQQELDSQKALQQAVAGGAFNKFAGVNTPDGSGFDAAGAYSDLLSKHPEILPAHASAAVESLQKIGQNMSEQRKTDAQAAEANAAVRAKTLESLASKLGSISDMPASKAATALDEFHQDLVKNPKAYPGLTQQEFAHLYASDLGHLDAMGAYMGIEGKMADFHKSKAEAIKAEQGIIPEGGGISPEALQKLHSDVLLATNPQIQQGKLDVAKAEATAKAQVAEAMEPIRLQLTQAFGNQKDARDKIETSVLKPYQDKMTDINMAKTAIAQAADNPVAARAAVFKMVGVAQPSGSHRVLPMEFAAFKYPGGLGTQAVEHFNDWLKGSPWTDDITQAANAFIDGQAQAAQQNLNSGVDNVNNLYNTAVGAGLKKGGSAKPATKILSPAEWLEQQKKKPNG